MQNFLSFKLDKENDPNNKPIVVSKPEANNQTESNLQARLAEKKVRFDPQLDFHIRPATAEPARTIIINKAVPKPKKKQNKQKSKSKAKSVKVKKQIQKTDESSNWNTSCKTGLFDNSIKKEMLDDKKRKVVPKVQKNNGTEQESDRLHERLLISKNGKTKSVEVYRSLQLLKEDEGKKPMNIVKRGRQVDHKRERSKKGARSTETFKEITEIERILKRGTSGDIIKDFTSSELSLIRQNEKILENLKQQLKDEKGNREKLENEIKSKLDYISTEVTKKNNMQEVPKAVELKQKPKKKAQLKKNPQRTQKRFAPIIKPSLPIKTDKDENKKLETMIKEEIEEDIRLNLPIRQPKPQYQEIADLLNHPMEKVKKLDYKTAEFVQTVEKSLSNVQKKFFDEANSQGIIGIVSRFAGKYIMSQSDKLAEIMLDELLLDVCVDLTNIENEIKESHLKREHMEMMSNLLLNIEEVESKENEVKFKYQHQKRELISKNKKSFNVFSIFEDPPPNPISMVKYSCPFTHSDEKPKLISMCISEEMTERIKGNRQRYSEYLKAINSSVSPELFKIYDLIAADLAAEVLDGAMQDTSKDMDEILDKMILGEFGVNSLRSSTKV